MADASSLPFQSLSFSLLENRRPRTAFKMRACSGDAPEYYELVIQKGSATNPSSQVKRQVPLTAAVALRDGLQRLGVFGWEGSYGDETAPGSRRWSLSIVFQEGVFSLESKGGSDAPTGFDGFLEELYRLDFPRPTEAKPAPSSGVGAATRDAMGALGIGSIGAMNAGDLGAYGATKGVEGDFSYLKSLFRGAPSPEGSGGLEGLGALGDLGDFDPSAIDPQEAAKLFAEMQRNPQAMEARLREEFRALSPREQSSMLDALTGLGFASRAWWERFFRGL